MHLTTHTHFTRLIADLHVWDDQWRALSHARKVLALIQNGGSTISSQVVHTYIHTCTVVSRASARGRSQLKLQKLGVSGYTDEVLE